MSRLEQRKAGAAATPGSTVVSASGGGLSLATYGVVGAAVGVWGAVVNAAATDPARRLQLTERSGAWAGGSHAVRGGVWIHAASIGEVKLAGRAGSRIRRTHSDLPLLLTCNTPTGRAAAAAVFDEVRYAPLDRTAVVRKVLDRVRPSLYVFVEAEIWPALLIEMNRADVPTVMVNARVSERSFARYRLAGRLIARALCTVDRVCARDDESAERLIALGARREATVVCGDMKLDPDPDTARCEATEASEPAELPAADGLPMLVAASVRTPELPEVLRAFGLLRRKGRRACLLLAPRYLDDASSVIELGRRQGLSVQRRSTAAFPGGATADATADATTNSAAAFPGDRGGSASAKPDVLVLDRYGELSSFYPRAVGCFVGGTLDGTGGHNIAEPAAAGLPVVTGPSLYNVQAHAAALAQCGGLQIAGSAEEIAAIWAHWLDEPGDTRQRGIRAKSCIEQRRGATARVAAELRPWLDRAADSFVRRSGVRA